MSRRLPSFGAGSALPVRRLSVALLLAAGISGALARRASAQGMAILGIDSRTTVLDDYASIYWAHVKLTVKNNTGVQSWAYAQVASCGPFDINLDHVEPDGTDDGVWEESCQTTIVSLLPGATGTIDLALPLWSAVTADVKISVGPGPVTSTDSALVHVIVPSSTTSWTASIVPFPPPTFTPSIQHLTTTSITARTTAAQWYTVTNRGNSAATFTFVVACSGSVINCTFGSSTTRTLALTPNSPSSVMVIYTAGAVGTAGQVRVTMTAPARPSGLVEADTSNLAVTAVDTWAPTIALAPGTSSDPDTGEPLTYAIVGRTATVTLDVCDGDGTVGTPTLTIGGVSVAPTTVVQTTACASAKRATFTPTFAAGFNSAHAVVSDGFHQAAVDQSFFYDDSYDNAATVTALHPSITLAAGAAATDTFLVANPGWRSATYAVAFACPFTVTCQLLGASSVSVAPGASVKVPVSYRVSSAPGQVQLFLNATYTSFSPVVRQAMMTVSVQTPPPQITITPSDGSENTGTAQIDWCDPDDQLVQHSATWQGLSLTDNFVATSRAGCASAGRSTYGGLATGATPVVIVATARDAAGNVTTSTATYYPSLAGMTPMVYAIDSILIVPRGSSGAQEFIVRNDGPTAITYTATAACGAMSSCVVTRPTLSLGPRDSTTDTVRFVAPSTFAARNNVVLTATYTAAWGRSVSRSWSVPVTTPAVGPLVTPKATPPVNVIVEPARQTTLNYTLTTAPVVAPTDVELIASCVSAPGWTCTALPNYASVTNQTLGVAVVVQPPPVLGSATAPPVTVRLVGLTSNGWAVLAADTGVMQAILAYHTPAAAPKGSQIAAAAGARRTEAFTIANRGNAPVVYALSASCGSFAAGGCAVSPATLSVAAGATGNATVAYTVPTINARTDTIKLIARYQPSATTLVEADTGRIVVTTQDQLAPTVAIAPSEGSVVTTRNLAVTTTVCDPDGAVGTPAMTLNGAPLIGTFASAVQAGCASAGTFASTATLQRGLNTIIATVSDGVHSTTLTRTVRYDETVEQRPTVVARVPYEQVATSSAWADSFTVRNPGTLAVSYALAASCPTGVTGCASTATRTVAGGEAAIVAVGYTTGVSSVRGPVKLTATLTGSTGATASSSDSTTVFVDAAPPTVVLSPVDGASVAPDAPITAQWCDADGTLVGHSAMLDGVALAGSFTVAAVPGCASAGTSTWSSILSLGSHTVTATATDGAGHSTTATTTFTVAVPPIASFRPLVTPKSLAASVAAPGDARSRTFVIQNTGSLNAQYDLTADCGTWNAVGACQPDRTSLTLAPGARDSVRVNFTVGQPSTSAALSLRATHRDLAGQTTADTGSVIASTPDFQTLYRVGVAPDPDVVVQPSTTRSISWTVTNAGAQTNTYAFGFNMGTATLVQALDTLDVLAPGQSHTVMIVFRTPTASNYVTMLTLNVWAIAANKMPIAGPTGNLVALSGITVMAPVPTYRVNASQMTGGDFAIPINATLTTPFDFTNTGASSATFNYQVTCSGIVLNCASTAGPISGTVTLASGETKLLPVTSAFPAVAQQLPNASGFANLTVMGVGPAAAATATSTANYRFNGPPSPRDLIVAPANGVIAAAPAQSAVASFSVTNAGSQSDAFSYTATCAGAVSCAAQSGTTSPLSGGAAATVNVAFQSSAALGATGTITLAATSVGDPTKSRSGSYAVTVAPPVGVIAVTAAAANPRDAISRGACLTIAAGDAAAYECGDLRLVHSLPATTTLNRVHAPTLIYTSAHVHPVTLVAADVTLDGSACNPNVTVTVRFSASDTSQRAFDWNAPCGQVATRRFVVPIDEQAHSHTTGVYRYSVEARITTSSGIVTATDTTGTLVVVDRSTAVASHFGAGWWLDGLEQLLTIPGRPDQLLWIGGDGSTRVYTRAAGDTLTYVVQPALDRPDTLQKVSTVEYRRHLSNGAYVAFDGFMRHVATVNALRHVTQFFWNSSVATQLDSIVLPVPAGGVRRTYAFGYTAGLLTSVTAPAQVGTSRVTTIVRTGSDLAIADPGSPAVHYLSDALGRVVIRTNRLGDGVLFGYDPAAGVLTRVAESMVRTSEDSIRTTFCPAEAASLAACAPAVVDPVVARTLLDGPRTDVADTTAFYLTRFGAPSRIVDALGHVTRFERSDPRWPMLTTKVVDPLGHTVVATYDAARALVRTTTDVNPNSVDSLTATGSAVTTYDWDPKWDHATRIVSPANVVSRFAYDPATGLRLSQSVGDNGARLVTYTYDPTTRLLKTVTTLQSASPSRFDYDAAGNLFRSTSPRGLVATNVRDFLGRDSVTQSPINDLPTTDWRYQAYTYDAQDRVLTSVDSAQTTGPGSPWEVLRVVNQYDVEGQLKQVTRRATPDPMGLGDIVLAADFDAIHRKTREYDPNRFGVQELRRWRYDQTGNAVSTTRGDATATAEYDALNRVVHRVVPGVATPYTPQAASDDQRFAYDAGGRLVSAVNNFAQVGRAYTLAGRLVLDTLRIASADLTSPNFGAHTYVLQSTYDAAGRRTSLTPPLALGVLTPVTYAYDATTGDLASIAPQNRGAFTFSYTAAGLLDSLIEADGTVERHYYDDDGRELRRSEISGVVGTIHDESIGLDARGKRTQVVSTGIGRPEQSAYSYDGLGGAIATNGRTIESTPRDPLGNATFHSRSTSLWEEDYTYEPHSTRLHFITQRLTESFQYDSVSQSFDLSGDLAQMTEQVTGQAQCPAKSGGFADCNSGARRLIADMHLSNSYDADGHLELAIKETSNDASSTWFRPELRDPNDEVVYPKLERGVLEEYRYDALGRRVWTRAHRNAYCPGERERDSTSVCISTIERAVYDGDQVLAEIRQPGDDTASVAMLESDVPIQTFPLQQFGLVGYVNGVSIDRPLEMDRSIDGNVQTAVLHYQWEGSVDVATTLDGHPLQCGMGQGVPAPTVPCQVIAWPGATQTFGIVLERPSAGAPSWWGTLVSKKQNATGMLDMRNRQYDPRTGRFTQEDPIGLAGGANLYGFGGGDAVNYADPFGLSPVLPVLAGVGAESLIGGGEGLGVVLGGPVGWIAAGGLALAGLLDRFAGPSGEPHFSERAATDATATGGSIPASGPRARAGERKTINDIGAILGCHECGAIAAGTKSGNWIPDHQPPTALNPPGGGQTLQPHCAPCSASQGGKVSQEVRKIKALQNPPPPAPTPQQQ